MSEQKHTPFNVILEDNGIFKAYDVMPYLMRCFDDKKNRKAEILESKDKFRDFVKSESMYMYWARCQYEIILSDWPCQKKHEKWDVHRQIMMNLDIVTDVLLKNLGLIELLNTEYKTTVNNED